MWTLLSSAAVAVLIAALLYTAGVVRQAGASWRGGAGLFRAFRRWCGQGKREDREAAMKRWKTLKWCSLWGSAGGAWVLYEYRFSILGVIALLFTTAAIASLLFALRKEQYARSYTQGRARQRRHAARFRATRRRNGSPRRGRARAAGPDAGPDAGRSRAGTHRLPRPVREAFRTLGLREGASREEVQAAYRRQAMKHHPDRYAQHSERVQIEQKERFQDVQWARATLDRYYS